MCASLSVVCACTCVHVRVCVWCVFINMLQYLNKLIAIIIGNSKTWLNYLPQVTVEGLPGILINVREMKTFY